MKNRNSGILVILASQLVGCGGQMVGWPDPDTTAPTVTTTDPVDGDDEFDITAFLDATFSEQMDPLSLTEATFTLAEGATPVTGTVTHLGTVATFDPTADLDADTEYTATITTGATDVAGNALATDHRWSFTTAADDDGIDTTAPIVILTNPADGGFDVAANVSPGAAFSEVMDPTSLTAASFLLEQDGTPIAGAVTIDGATAAFDPNASLSLDTEYTATITTDATDLAGNPIADDYVWTFTIASDADIRPPVVILTSPEDEERDVAPDVIVDAAFSEAMDPLTLTSATFTLADGTAPVPGVVTRSGATAAFDPDTDLDPDTEYTATITTSATDVAGNPLADDYVWTFTIGAELDDTPPTVVLTDPRDKAPNVEIGTDVHAAFSEAMDATTISALTFELADGTNPPVTGVVDYDELSLVATFDPSADLRPGTTYTATVTTGAMDLEGNGLAEDYVWTFDTAAAPSGLQPVNLRSLSTFVAVAGAGLTNSNSSGITTLNGDVGLSPTATCIGDGSPCSLINPVINGTLYANDPSGIAAQAKTDLTAAYTDAMGRPAGTTVNDLTGMTLPPGVYTSGSTMSIAVGGTVILDGRGDPNAVWIFQVGSSFTVNNNAQVLLINGARASNVFWGVFASSTMGSNVTFQGSILAGASNSLGTDSVVVGRLLCTTGQITLLSNNVTLPPL